MRRFELVEGTSSKFWEIEQKGSAVVVRYGRIGTAGQSSEKSYPTPEKARAEHDKLVAEKTKKGYAEVGGAPGAAPAAPAGPIGGASKTLTIFADYHHFYLCDRACTEALGDAWTADAVDDRLAIGEGVIGIGTARNVDVKVDVQILAAAPADDSADFQHVTECSVPVPSGELLVNGPADEITKARIFAVPAGSVIVRASHVGLDTLSDDGLKGEDRYRLQIWPGEAEARVIKRFVVVEKPKASVELKPPKTFKQAMEVARAGRLDLALPKLEALASKEGKDQGYAAYAITQIRAYQGDFAGALAPMETFFRAYVWGAVNPFDDMLELLLVIGEATGDWATVKGVAERAKGIAPKWDPVPKFLERLAKRERRPRGRGAIPLNRPAYDKAVLETRADRKLAGKPDELARRLFALAHSYGAEDDALAFYEQHAALLYWHQSIEVAKILVRRGKPDDAWTIVKNDFPRWQGGFVAEVAPTELLVDPSLSGILTPERGKLLLAIARG